MSVKLVPGIVSAPPPPRAFAVPAYAAVARNITANMFDKVPSWIACGRFCRATPYFCWANQIAA
jgi:hypothetical protein